MSTAAAAAATTTTTTLSSSHAEICPKQATYAMTCLKSTGPPMKKHFLGLGLGLAVCPRSSFSDKFPQRHPEARPGQPPLAPPRIALNRAVGPNLKPPAAARQQSRQRSQAAKAWGAKRAHDQKKRETYWHQSRKIKNNLFVEDVARCQVRF